MRARPINGISFVEPCGVDSPTHARYALDYEEESGLYLRNSIILNFGTHRDIDRLPQRGMAVGAYTILLEQCLMIHFQIEHADFTRIAVQATLPGAVAQGTWGQMRTL